MSSFNFDMDKYIEKRKSVENLPAVAPKPKKRKGKLATLLTIKDAIKSILDADEVINIGDDDKSNVSIYHKKSFSEKLSDILTGTRSVHIDASKDSAEVEVVDEPADEPTSSRSGDVPIEHVRRVMQESGNDLPEEDMLDDGDDASEDESYDDSGDADNQMSSRRPILGLFSRRERDGDNDDGLQDEMIAASEREQFRKDLREIVKINYRVIKQLPPETIRIFRESEDFKRFVRILDKYDLVKHNHNK